MLDFIAMTYSTLQHAANEVLERDYGQGLIPYLEHQIARGMSPERIATQLHIDTDGIIHITRMSVERWLDQFNIEKVTA